MAWQSLSLRITSVPLVIAGPILRRVTSGKIVVWLVLKEAKTNATLKVYDTNKALILTATASTVQFGAKFHLLLFNKTQSNVFQADKVYYYDIDFGSSITLASATGNFAWGYGHPVHTELANLPSFSLPPTNLSNLRIVHASCRKPHGGNTSKRNDALPILNDFISTAKSNADSVAEFPSFNHPLYDFTYAAGRPQQLYLTGDQIYADDVDPVLLYMLGDARATIFNGQNEVLPPIEDTATLNINNREDLMKEIGFSEGDVTENHLVYFGEFFCMYLFAWSDTLWGIDFPDFALLHPGVAQSTEVSYHYASEEQHTVKTYVYKKYLKSITTLDHFRSELIKVRKALANVPTYMIFDDHEVTDDWNLNLEWVNAVHNIKPDHENVGIRIIQNALCAYVVCQALGNTPDNIPSDLITNIANWSSASAPGENPVAKKIRRYLGLPTTDTSTVQKISYHYQIDFQSFITVVLDIRTNRELTGSKRIGSGLIKETEMSLQLPTQSAISGKEFILLISGAPVIGHPGHESSTVLAKTSWMRFFLSQRDLDYEAWGYTRSTFEELLNKLSNLNRVIILSGDVHYAFSAQVEYWNQRASNVKEAVFAQFCASSLKNDDYRTIDLGNEEIAPQKWFDYDITDPASQEIELLGWNKNSNPQINVQSWLFGKRKRNVLGPNPLMERSLVHSLITPTNWQYRITFKRDMRPPEDRETDAYFTMNIPPELHNTSLFPVMIHANMVEFENHRTAVGFNNLGLLKFSWGAGAKYVTQELWYNPQDNSANLLPYTHHTVLLDIPGAASKPIP